MDTRAATVVAKTWMGSEASVIKSLLASYQIPCHYVPELPHNIYPMKFDCRREISIYVPASLAEEARRILAEHRRTHAHLRLVYADEIQKEKA